MFDNIEYISLNNSEYFEFLNGLWTGKKPPFQKVGVIRNTNFTNSGIIDYSDVAYLDVEVRAFEKRKLYPGDIIIERSGGGPKQPVGRVVFFENSEENFSFSNFTSTIRCKDANKIHPKFLHYCLLEFYFFQNIQRFQAQTTGLRNLDFSKYCETVQVPLLTITEQKKIAKVLDLMQSSILQQQQIINTVQQLKKNLLHKLFTEGVNNEPQKETEIGLIPESWEVAELHTVCDKISVGYTPVQGGNKKYVGLEHMVGGEISISEYGSESEVKSSKNVFEKGQLLYGKLRPYLDKCCIADFDGVSSTDIIILNGKNNVSNEFLVHLLHTKEFIQQAKSTTTGVQHPRTSWNTLKSYKFALPKKGEREQISKTLNVLHSKINFNQRKKQTLEALFKTMLHKLMMGEIRVNELELSKIKEYKLEEDKLSIAAEP